MVSMSGEFSMAAIQANNLLEDPTQVESGLLSSSNSGPNGTFIGVYDGHGGPQTSRFVNENLFANLKKFAYEDEEMSAHVIKKAFLATEDEFLSIVREQWRVSPQIVTVGTCCLVGVICNGLMDDKESTLKDIIDAYLAYLEKTQAELRDTFTAAEKFRRELEFLQKGCDSLDLQVGNGTSVSLRSTSLFDQHPVTSEVKGSFAIIASPHGDSVESSGRLGALSVSEREPNSADNLMLFDRENKFHDVEKRSLHLHKNNTVSDVALEFPKKS